MRTLVLNHFHTFHPDAQAEIDRLAREDARLALAMSRRVEEPAPKRRMSAPAENLEKQREDLAALSKEQKAIVRSGVVVLVFLAKNRKEYRRLLTAHPPRDGDELDQQVGYNVDTFGDVLIQACLSRCQDLDGNKVENKWDTWADEMTDGQWSEIFRGVLKLNQGGNPTVPR